LKGLTFDAGALIAFDRNDRRIVVLIARARQRQVRLAAPAGVVGQVWRDGRRQARLARLLASCDIVPLDDHAARAAGQLLGVAGGRDVIDASVVLCARQRGDRVLSSDCDDLRALDPRVDIEPI
jgi:predicted nucleic acid-binding protein